MHAEYKSKYNLNFIDYKMNAQLLHSSSSFVYLFLICIQLFEISHPQKNGLQSTVCNRYICMLNAYYIVIILEEG